MTANEQRLLTLTRYEPWKCGRFDFHRAVCCREERHLRDLFNWMQASWFP
jgi:hypothetical protein